MPLSNCASREGKVAVVGKEVQGSKDAGEIELQCLALDVESMMKFDVLDSIETDQNGAQGVALEKKIGRGIIARMASARGIFQSGSWCIECDMTLWEIVT